MVFLVLGVVAALDLSDAVAIPPSGYFAAALVTIAFGLLVGTWFGRARWLIALGLVTAAALGVTHGRRELRRDRRAGRGRRLAPDQLRGPRG